MGVLEPLYQNLRACFGHIRDEVLGEDYYTTDMSVSGSDKQTCIDILRTIRRLKSSLKWSYIFNVILGFILILVLFHLVF